MQEERKVELVEKETPFQGHFRVSRYHLRHTQFRGGMGPTISREVFERGHAACVIPYDPATDTVVLIEQFRPGCFAADDPNPWMIEIVAGVIDPGETPEAVCRRECTEEAGLDVTDLHKLGHHYLTPGGSSESMHFYVGRCDASRAGGVHGLDEEGEDIRVFTVPSEEAIRMACDNEIRNAMTSLALLLFQSCRETLRKHWV